MPRTTNLMGSGLVPLQTTAILGKVTNTLTATGATQGTALLLPSEISVFTTVASGTGAILPAGMAAGDMYTVCNHGANALLVYPPTGGAIGTGATNAGASVAAGKTADFYCITPLLFGASIGA